MVVVVVVAVVVVVLVSEWKSHSPLLPTRPPSRIVASALENNLSDRRFCRQFKFVAVSDKGWPTLKKVRSVE